MTLNTNELLVHKLDLILRILAVLATRDMKQREQIALLSKAGLQPKDIATLLGTSSNTVRVELVALRKSKRGKGRKKPSAVEG
jgi:DNA-directed RNA polymerase specialized sigma24 family protein